MPGPDGPDLGDSAHGREGVGGRDSLLIELVHTICAIAMFWGRVVRLLREIGRVRGLCSLTPPPDMGLDNRRRVWQVPKPMSRFPSHLNIKTTRAYGITRPYRTEGQVRLRRQARNGYQPNDSRSRRREINERTRIVQDQNVHYESKHRL